MNSTAIRMYVVVAIILATLGVTRLIGIAVEPPEVELPPWSLKAMPLEFGNWRGEEAKTDPEIFAASGANAIVDRFYRDDQAHVVTSHTATFADPDEGIYHNPNVCYPAHGWKRLRDTTENLDVSDDLTIPVRLAVWENNNEKVMVVYWYQLGNRILHERWELGKARLAMRGQKKWPVLLKVMVQMPVDEKEDSEGILFGFTKQLAGWLNNPEHEKYLGRWGGI